MISPPPRVLARPPDERTSRLWPDKEHWGASPLSLSLSSLSTPVFTRARRFLARLSLRFSVSR